MHQVWDVNNHNCFLLTRCATKITNLSYSFTVTHKQNSEATKPFSFDRIFHQGFLSCCISCWCSTAGSSYPAATQCRKTNAEEKTEVKLNQRRIRKQQPTLCRPAIQCKNPAATECRKTSAEEKNDSTPLHVAAGPDTVYQDFLCTATRFWCSCKKAIAPSRMVWDGLESSQNKTYCVHSKSPMILLPTSLAQVLITFLPILETRRRNL